jgi:predicted MFS family arabinose efflux permease
MCKRDEEGEAAAMYAFSRQFGIAFGVGVGGTVFQNVMGMKLEWQGLHPGIAKISEAFLAELSRLPADDVTGSYATEAYIFGLRGVYLLVTCMSAAAFLLSTLLEYSA